MEPITFESWDQLILYLSQNDFGLKISRNKYIRVWNEATEAIDYVGSTDEADTYLLAASRTVNLLRQKINQGVKGKMITD